MNRDASRSRSILRSFSTFVSEGCGIDLFYYQLQPAQAILESVRLGQGLTFVLDFPYQSGKDELLTHLKVYLMRMMNDKDRKIIEVNSYYENQITAITRLVDLLHGNILTRGRWNMESSFFSIDKCSTIFLCMDDITDAKNVLADLLLIFNNAHDLLPAEYDKKNKQLSARRKITRVIIGSDLGDGTLMFREKEKAILEEQNDGIKRFFQVTEQLAKMEMKKLSD